MLDFPALYRKCLRQNKLKCTTEEIQNFLDNTRSMLIVSDHTITSFIDFKGLKIQGEDCVGFFPKESAASFYRPSGINFIREQCLKADFVLPPFMKMGFLSDFAQSIATTTNIEHVAEDYFPRMFNLESLSALYVEMYAKNSDFEIYRDQIKEAIEAYCLGINKVAVTALLPCIEGIIRTLGLKIGLRCSEHVSLHHFVDILEKIQKSVINKVFTGFSWVPNDYRKVALHDCTNEQVQIIESLIYFLKNALYKNTTEYQGSTNLNRHGVLHGLIADFSSHVNFFRLITVLNALYICSLLTGSSGSFFHPPSTDSSRALETRLLKMRLFRIGLDGGTDTSHE
jgi:hypothetical protein